MREKESKIDAAAKRGKKIKEDGLEGEREKRERGENFTRTRENFFHRKIIITIRTL